MDEHTNHERKLCATVTGATTEELRSKRDGAAGAEMVELRLDYARHIDVAGVLGRPAVSGRRDVSAHLGGRAVRWFGRGALRLLGRALELGADYVDVEWRGNAIR